LGTSLAGVDYGGESIHVALLRRWIRADQMAPATCLTRRDARTTPALSLCLSLIACVRITMQHSSARQHAWISLGYYDTKIQYVMHNSLRCDHHHLAKVRVAYSCASSKPWYSATATSVMRCWGCKAGNALLKIILSRRRPSSLLLLVRNPPPQLHVAARLSDFVWLHLTQEICRASQQCPSYNDFRLTSCIWNPVRVREISSMRGCSI
jgi:hypothetical protein